MTRTPRRGWRAATIRARAFLLVALGTLAPMLVLGGVAAARFGRLRAELDRERAAKATLLADRVDAAVHQCLAALSAAASYPRFDLADGDDAPERLSLRDVRHQAPSLESAFLVDAAGRVVLSEPPEATLAREPIESALRDGRPVVSGLVPAPSGARVYVLVPILAWNGRVAAIVGGTVNPAQAWSGLLRTAALGASERAELLDASGSLLVRTPALQASAAEAAAATPPRPLAHAPWRLVLYQPDVGASSARRLGSELLAAVPALLGLSLLFAWGTARSVTQPLAVLADSAQRIAGGDLGRPIPPLGEDEVGRLGRALEEMRTALERSLEAVTRANLELERKVDERTAELRTLYGQLRERDHARGQLLRKVIATQEEERKRIARELHDESCQTLSALLLHLDAAADPDADPVTERQESRALALRALDEMHRLILDLRPSVLDDLGLLPAIRWLAERQLESRGIAVRCEFEEPERPLAAECETALFRATQEAINNVVRHARAETVLIQVAARDDALVVEIEDDGCGFDPAEVDQPTASGRGLGLLGIRERLELLGGTAQLDSAPGRGTQVTLRVPLERATEAR